MTIDQVELAAEAEADEGVDRLPAGQRVMLLSYTLPPALLGSASIVDNLSRAFDTDEMILVGAHWPGEKQSRDPPWPRIMRVASAWRWNVRGVGYIRWLRWLALPLVMLRLLRLFRREDCRWLICVFPDEYFLFAGYLLAKWTGAPFYPYFHNSYVDNRRGLALRFARWLEPRVFERAKIVYVMSDGLKRHYQAKYSNVCIIPLVHTFNDELLDVSEPPHPADTVRIGVLGTLNESNEDALQRFAHVVKLDPTYRLTIYSSTPAWAFRARGIVGENITVTRVAPDQVGAELARHDVLFLPHGLQGGLSDVEYRTIFPTRTIPYLISGRPILAHVPRDSFLASFLEEHRCAEVVVQPSDDELRGALSRLATDEARRRELVKNAFAAAKLFQGELVAQELRRQLLQSVCEASSASV